MDCFAGSVTRFSIDRILGANSPKPNILVWRRGTERTCGNRRRWRINRRLAKLGFGGRIDCSTIASSLVLDPNRHTRLKASRLFHRLEAQAKGAAGGIPHDPLGLP